MHDKTVVKNHADMLQIVEMRAVETTIMSTGQQNFM